MLIRTQNKKGIVNLNNIDTIDTRNNQIRYWNGGGIETMGIMGVYSTEEKAIKVLDDICSFANGLHFEKIATDQCGRLDGVVFQMPQDSEV